MAILQVGSVTGAAYEWSHHIHVGRRLGVSDDDVRAVLAQSQGRDGGLPALDRAVVRAARETTIDLKVAVATFAELEATLSTEHLVDLCLVIAVYNLIVRLLLTLEIDLEPDDEALQTEIPAPEAVS